MNTSNLDALPTKLIRDWIIVLEENRDLPYPQSICHLTTAAVHQYGIENVDTELVNELVGANDEVAKARGVSNPVFWVSGEGLDALISEYVRLTHSDGSHPIHNARAYCASNMFTSEDGRTLADNVYHLSDEVIKDLDTYAQRRREHCVEHIAFLTNYLAQRQSDAA